MNYQILEFSKSIAIGSIQTSIAFGSQPSAEPFALMAEHTRLGIGGVEGALTPDTG
jgi:hypothetical protein